MEDVASVITATCSSIKEAIERNQMGRTKNVSKDFLSPASTDTRICRKVNAWKRKCSAIKLSVLSDDLRSEIKKGVSYFSPHYSYFHIATIQSHAKIEMRLQLESQVSSQMKKTSPSPTQLAQVSIQMKKASPSPT